MTEYPSFYDPERIGALFTPDMAEIEQAAIQAGLPPVSPDEPQVHLLLVDMQVDFCHEQGSLYVPGALGDVRRVIEFIFRNAAVISQITCSLGSPTDRFLRYGGRTQKAATRAVRCHSRRCGGGLRPLGKPE